MVRATGGMIDTVFDRDNSGHPPDERTGFVFHHTDNRAIESALGRALRLRSVRASSASWPSTACAPANSWARPGQEYLDIYRHVRHR